MGKQIYFSILGTRYSCELKKNAMQSLFVEFHDAASDLWRQVRRQKERAFVDIFYTDFSPFPIRALRAPIHQLRETLDEELVQL